MTLRDKLGIPGPKPNIFFGNMLEMFEYNKNVIPRLHTFNCTLNIIILLTAWRDVIFIPKMEKTLWKYLRVYFSILIQCTIVAVILINMQDLYWAAINDNSIRFRSGT